MRLAYETTDWYNLHSKSWGKELVAGMHHPAKAKIKLAERIYRHAIEENWVKEGDLCLDPFAGVGCFSLHAILNGLNWVGVELEENFVESAEKNIVAWQAKYKGMPHLGTAVVLRGDSRRLKEVLKEWKERNCKLVCSSPPYSGTPIAAYDGSMGEMWRETGKTPRQRTGGKLINEQYGGDTEGQLGNMPIGTAEMICSSPPFLDQFPCQADNYEGFEHVGTVKRGAIGGKYADDTKGNLSSMPVGNLIIASPPYIDSMNANSGANDTEARLRRMEAAGIDITDSKNVGGPNNVYKHPQAYGNTEGQLGSMPVGNMILSSPPYVGSLSGQTDGIDWSICKDGGKIRDFTNEPGQAVRLHMGKAYSENEGNLGNLPEGNLLVSSPPYVESLASDDPDKRGGLFRDPRRHDDPTLTATYGDTVGQLGVMKAGMVLSSPPYGEALSNPDDSIEFSGAGGAIHPRNYGSVEGNLGNMEYGEEVSLLTSSPPYENMVNASGEGPSPKYAPHSGEHQASAQMSGIGYSKDNQDNLGNESGETFWGAAKLIVQACFDVLKPGAHACWVLKDYIKAGSIVPFTQSWVTLCEQCGFELIHWHRAWLTEDRGLHLTLDGGVVHKRVKYVSFFRRLYESREGNPSIEWESVLCFKKPV